jgi:tetratricopeptide (TPR) repeat protein
MLNLRHVMMCAMSSILLSSSAVAQMFTPCQTTSLMDDFILESFLPVTSSLCIAQIDSSVTNPDSLLKCAYRYFAHDNTDSARILFTMVLSSKPHATQAQLGLIQLKMAEEDWSSAAELCDRLIKVNPDNIAIHYLAGISDREKALGGVTRMKSRDHFEAVLARDSLYKDVLYQYALLKEDEEEFPQAIALAYRQIVLRPELVDAQAGLLHLYRHYISVTHPTEALTWLSTRKNDYGRYFGAEVLRRNKQFMQAETTLYGLLNRPSGELPLQASYLSLAHMYAIAGKTGLAVVCYWRAVDGIKTWLGGKIVFEDLKYIITDDELKEYGSIFSDRLKKAFFHRVWETRDPMPATAINERLVAHLQRYVQAEEQFEYYGRRPAISNPDWMHVLRLPKAFRLNREFNDLGLIFLRQGPPSYIERTAGNPTNENDPNDNMWKIIKNDPTATPMSKARDQKYISKSAFPETNMFGPTAIDPHQAWIYSASDEEPQRILHFALHNTSHNNWRLTPLPGEAWNLDDEMLEKLQAHDGEYSRLLKAPRLETTQRAADLQTQEVEVVATALATDRHVWSNGTKEISIPHAIDAFRNPSGGTLLDVSYAIPYAPLREVTGPGTKRVLVEVGISTASRTSKRMIDSRLDTLDLLLTPDGKGSYIGLFRQVLVADSVRLTAHVRALQAQVVGTWSERLRVPAFTGKDFMLSDLQLLLPTTDDSSIKIDGVKVQQSPFRSYSRAKPLCAYVQVYNLVKDIEGKAAYNAKFTIAPNDDPEEARVLAEVKRDLSDKSYRAEFQMLDIKGISPGKYVLTVSVTDRKRVETISRSREVEITQ